MEWNQLLVFGDYDFVRLFFEEKSMYENLPYPIRSDRKGNVVYAFLPKNNYYVNRFLEEHIAIGFEEHEEWLSKNRIYAIAVYPPRELDDCDYIYAIHEWKKTLEEAVEDDLKKFF